VFSCQARQIAANSCRILPPSLQALFAAKREVMRQSTDLPALLKHLARAGAQEIANSLWAFATLEHHTGAQLLDAAAVQIARRIEQFSPQARAPALRPKVDMSFTLHTMAGVTYEGAAARRFRCAGRVPAA